MVLRRVAWESNAPVGERGPSDVAHAPTVGVVTAVVVVGMKVKRFDDDRHRWGRCKDDLMRHSHIGTIQLARGPYRISIIVPPACIRLPGQGDIGRSRAN